MVTIVCLHLERPLKKLHTGEGKWKLQGNSSRLRQQVEQEAYVQRLFSVGNGDTEDFSLLIPDTNWVSQLPTSLDRGSLLAQVYEGLAQSHTAFRAFPTLLPSQPHRSSLWN